MTEKQHREAHEAFLRQLNALDRQYAPDAPESPEEAEWLKNRMKEITNSLSLPYERTIRPLLEQEVLHEGPMFTSIPLRE